MASNRSIFALLGILVIALVGINFIYIVKETERAVLLKFGEVVEADVPPGPHFKMPIMHKVRKFDARVMTLDAKPQRYLTSEKKYLIVDSFVKWRIIDVQKYYTVTSGEEFRAQRVLEPRVEQGLRREFGVRTMHEVVSGQRDALMEKLTEQLNKETTTNLGIEVLDIRIKGINLPTDVSNSVYSRMEAEREKEARDYRAKGKKQAEQIRASADREKTVIESDAYKQAQIIRGEGDAVSANTYAAAYSKNAEFYAFWRSLQAYEESFAGSGDVLILDSNNEFFNYLNQSKK